MKTSARSLLLFTFLFVCCAGSRAAEEAVFPFVLPWDDAAPGVTDLSGLLDKPAGGGGRVRIGPDAHFYVGEKRIRFMGVNVAFAAGMPAPEDGAKIAARMAKFGINVVRFHHMDSGAWPNGLRLKSAKDTGQIDPEALARLDEFIARLKEHGIYANLNLLVGRPFNAADGLPREIETMEWKDRHVVGFWNARELALQQAYARALLTHTNPFTKSDYTSEPAVAFVEINNEAGLIHSWLGGSVDRYPAVFLADLEQQWNSWLRKRYPNDDALRQAWSAGAQPLGEELLKQRVFVSQETGGSAQKSGYAQPLKGWTVERHENAQGNVSASNGVARIEVVRPGPQMWHLQMSQGGFALENGKDYTVSFRARSSAPRTISTGVSQAHEPWSGLGLAVNPQLSNTWQAFRFVFNASQADTNARLFFGSFGPAGSVIELADVSLREGGVEGLASSEKLGRVPRFQKASYGQRTPEAQRDWMRFLNDTEDRYWQAMYRFLKDELKVKALIGGTIGGCSPLNVQAKMDWVDTHAYWQHPHFPHKPWDPADWIVKNVSMVNEKGGTLPGLALKRVAGKPHAVTEYNHAAPNTYSSEGFLLAAAYGGLQDWDAIYGYCYAHTRNGTAGWDARKITGFFDIDQHPTKMATWITAAAMFLTGEVKPARGEVKASLPVEREIDLLRSARPWSLVDGATAGLARETPLMQRVAVSLESFQTPRFAFPRPSYASDTDELMWDVTTAGRGVVTINTAGVKGVLGYGAGKTFQLGDISIAPGPTMQEGWSTVTVLARGKGRYLITATGYAENMGMAWKNPEKDTVGRDWGDAPSRVEGVSARIRLPSALVGHVKAWALDERGQRKQEIALTASGAGGAELNIGPRWRTLWYEVAAE